MAVGPKKPPGHLPLYPNWTRATSSHRDSLVNPCLGWSQGWGPCPTLPAAQEVLGGGGHSLTGQGPEAGRGLQVESFLNLPQGHHLSSHPQDGGRHNEGSNGRVVFHGSGHVTTRAVKPLLCL